MVQEQNDIFGAAVHTANRMTSQAKAKQIVMSGVTVEQMSEEWAAQTRQIDIATVRGRIGEVALYELLWQPDEATSMVPTLKMTSKKKNGTRLVLTFREKTVEVNDTRTNINLGRGDDNDLVVKGNLISRIHAKIEKRRGKFRLIDQSTNGTFLQTVAGEETFVRRDSIELVGEGIIGLGRIAKAGTPLAIHYTCGDCNGDGALGPLHGVHDSLMFLSQVVRQAVAEFSQVLPD